MQGYLDEEGRLRREAQDERDRWREIAETVGSQRDALQAIVDMLHLHYKDLHAILFGPPGYVQESLTEINARHERERKA